jgi:hypothetical protein
VVRRRNRSVAKSGANIRRSACGVRRGEFHVLGGQVATQANLLVCRYEEDRPATLQGNFSTGKCVTTVVPSRDIRNGQTTR